MRASAAWVLLFSISLLAADAFTCFAASITQKNSPASTGGGKLLTRTTTRREGRRFGHGGTVTVVGAPTGSITVEGWPRAEVEVVANIEQKAESEDDLARLATVNGFVFDDDVNHVSILTTGTHDKAFMRRAAKGFPKHLLTQPWKIDYRIRVPANVDLEINGGRGPIKLSGVEGAIRLSVAEGDASLIMTGGVVSATIASGNVLMNIPVRSWRGGGADVRVATGTLTVELLPGFNGDIDAEVLRTGQIEDAYGGLESREKPGLTPTLMRARAGVGGAFFKFTVGAGTIRIKKPELVDK